MRVIVVKFVLLCKRKIESFWMRYFMKPYWKSMFKKMGDNVYIGKNCSFIFEHVEIGDNVFIAEGARFLASIATIHIGNHVMFGPNVTIRGGDHRTDMIGCYMDTIMDEEKLPQKDKDVFIDDDVWIGCNVTILKGVHIGRGAVVGAGSLVVKDVSPYTIHVGVPKPQDFKRFSEDELVLHEKIYREK